MNLKEIRLKRGMKLCELAEAIGLSSQAVYYYETGAREPNLETLRKLANVLDCSIDELIGSQEQQDEENDEC